MTSEGRAWQNNGITKSQVLKVHQFIEDEAPEIHVWFRSKLDYAVEQGWLAAS
jgi:putative hydrolase of HD superfamily